MITRGFLSCDRHICVARSLRGCLIGKTGRAKAGRLAVDAALHLPVAHEAELLVEAACPPGER